MIIQKIFEIVERLKGQDSLIREIKWSPDKDAIIIDVNFGRVLRISVDGNIVHVQGDLYVGNKLKEMIEGAIKDGN